MTPASPALVSSYTMPSVALHIGHQAKPLQPLHEFLEARLKEVSDRGCGLLGLGLTRFDEIAQRTDGIQPGLYVTAADTNVGKTAFQTSMFADLLDSNPDAVGIYFSFDDPKHVIVNRLIGIETGIALNQLQRKLGEPHQARRAGAYQKHIKLAKEGRFFLKDIGEVFTLDRMEAIIREHASNKLFVVIDGLQNLCLDPGAGMREANIEIANRVKAISDRYNIPILVTVEVRKKQRTESQSKGYTLHDIMESGKFAYNASVVWILEEAGDRDEHAEDEERALNLTFAKNKLSHFKGVQKLTFRRTCGKISIDRDNGLPTFPSQRAVAGWDHNAQQGGKA